MTTHHTDEKKPARGGLLFDWRCCLYPSFLRFVIDATGRGVGFDKVNAVNSVLFVDIALSAGGNDLVV